MALQNKTKHSRHMHSEWRCMEKNHKTDRILPSNTYPNQSIVKQPKYLKIIILRSKFFVVQLKTRSLQGPSG